MGLFQRALVTAEIESTFGVDPIPVVADDSLLVSDPDFSADLTVIERNFARTSISPLPISIGRKLASMTFTHEVRGSGSTSTKPAVSKLLRACGMAETQIVVNGGTGARVTVVDDDGLAPVTTWAFAGAFAFNPVKKADYKVTVVLGGATAVAKVRVTGGTNPQDQDVTSGVILAEEFTASSTGSTQTLAVNATDPLSITYTVGGAFEIGAVLTATVLGVPFVLTVTGGHADNNGVADALAVLIDAHPLFIAPNPGAAVVGVTFTGVANGVVITSGVTAVTLGTSGMTATPTWASNQILGNIYSVNVNPIGWQYDFVSDAFASITIYMYFAEVLHKLTGARGTCTVEGKGGDLAKFNFTFTGNYVAPVDSAIPAGAVFESTIPQQVELADLAINSGSFSQDEVTSLCAGAFSIDFANDIQPRECINEQNSFDGVLLVKRNPVGTFDPEAVTEATWPFWANLSAATTFSFKVRVGTTTGNVVRFESDSAQLRGLSYADRNGIRVYNADLQFSQVSGDDELRISFN